MKERLEKVEQALEELREENRLLRQELEELKALQAGGGAENQDPLTPAQRRAWGRWSVILLIISLVAVPVLALTVWHTNAFWTTAISFLNALLVYIVGPGAVRLLAEGILRAVPAILLGQTTRIAVDKFRQRRSSR